MWKIYYEVSFYQYDLPPNVKTKNRSILSKSVDVEDEFG